MKKNKTTRKALDPSGKNSCWVAASECNDWEESSAYNSSVDAKKRTDGFNEAYGTRVLVKLFVSADRVAELLDEKDRIIYKKDSLISKKDSEIASAKRIIDNSARFTRLMRGADGELI